MQPTVPSRSRRILAGCIAAALSLSQTGAAHAQPAPAWRDLASPRWLSGVVTASAVYGLGSAVSRRAGPAHAGLTPPPALDRSLRDLFYTGRHTNWLDQNGVYYTLIGGGLLAGGAPFLLADEDKFRQGFFEGVAFTSGALFAGGITEMVKGLVSRPRPLLYFHSDSSAAAAAEPDNYRSFFSGHASLAFYTATYLHIRLDRLLAAYAPAWNTSHWRMVRGAVLYGWATYMAYSRLTIDKHYFTDVAAGTAAGHVAARLTAAWFWHRGQPAHRRDGTRVQFNYGVNSVHLEIDW